MNTTDMNTDSKRVEGTLELQGKNFHYQILHEKGRKFVKIANILFERNTKINLLEDIREKLFEKNLI